MVTACLYAKKGAAGISRNEEASCRTQQVPLWCKGSHIVYVVQCEDGVIGVAPSTCSVDSIDAVIRQGYTLRSTRTTREDTDDSLKSIVVVLMA